MNLARLLARAASVFPDAPAVSRGPRRIASYAELAARCARLAAALRERLKLAPGDRVALLMANCPEYVETLWASWWAGLAPVPINAKLHPREAQYILAHTEARLAFVTPELVSGVGPLAQALPHLERLVEVGSPEYDALASGATTAPIHPTADDDVAWLFYTSGTTGRPKGVMYGHRGAWINAVAEVIETGMSFDTRSLWTLPMFHCNGWCFTWGVTAVAGTHVCLRKVEPARIWELIDTEGVTHYNGAPTVHVGVVNDPKAHALTRPVTVTVAGAPPSPTLLGRLRELGFRPVHVYGLTETYGPHTVCAWHAEWDALPPEEQARLAARQGQGYALFDLVRVVDANMNDVPRDGQTLGEVVMRGNNAMTGYFKQRDATAEAFRGGWFHSGDIAVWHPDGYIELRDRKKDIIISGGENISTIEVEQAVVKHPAVLECAVVAIPDEKWGERPKAFVTLKPGQRATEGEIIEFCRQHIAHFKCPAAIEFGELPKTSTGKVQKFVLRDREWKGQEKRIH